MVSKKEFKRQVLRSPEYGHLSRTLHSICAISPLLIGLRSFWCFNFSPSAFVLDIWHGANAMKGASHGN
jgi:hypothetical protein